ncbi:hypothetical protein FT642_20045 [Bacillus paranthracis]|uniref:hypothetical protein n=1 Tax=Bacillus paranthracis TaxID=2026186 RepID=UPI001879486A|nr:hypothetical protein [Bacillus paranthracis]
MIYLNPYLGGFVLKKYLLLIVAISFTIGLSACNTTPEQKQAKEEEKQQKEQEKLEKKQQKEAEKEQKEKDKEIEKQRKEQEKLEKKKQKEAEKEQNKKSTLTVDEYKNRINNALKEMGDKTRLKINSTEILDEGRTSLALSNNIIIFLDTNKDNNITKASLGMTANAYLTEQEDFKFAFLLLIGTMDDSLSFGDRNLVKQELGINDEKVFSKDYSKSYKKNGIMYTYKGSMKDNFILQAELRK